MRSFVVDCQLAHILDIGLDDFLKQTIDSTSVGANSAWPTELHLIERVLNDAYGLGQLLDQFGLLNFHQRHIANWLKKLSDCEFDVQ